jgi:uncharacterized delta-60 repeat protein
VARLTPEWDLDVAFRDNVQELFDEAEFLGAAQQSDGKILLAGYYRPKNSLETDWRCVIRLLPDGQPDAAFNDRAAGLFKGVAYAVAALPDGGVLVGGNFSVNGQSSRSVARLSAAGDLATSFAQNVGTGLERGGAVAGFLPVGDGRTLVFGDFTSFNEAKVEGLALLDADGHFDAEFSRNAARGFFSGFSRGGQGDLDRSGHLVAGAALQPDGRIVLGGEFVIFGDGGKVTRSRVIRLLPDGTLDEAFSKKTAAYDVKSEVDSILLLPDGGVVAGTDTPFLRFAADGTPDQNFMRSAGAALRGRIYAMQVDGAGKMILAGAFSAYKGVTARNVVRIESNGALDEVFLNAVGR